MTECPHCHCDPIREFHAVNCRTNDYLKQKAMTEPTTPIPCPVCSAEYCQQGCRCMCHASKPIEQQPEVRKTPCCGYEFKTPPDPGPILWNPYNEVVQCHNCGASFDERKPIEQHPDWKAKYEQEVAGVRQLAGEVHKLVEERDTALANYAIADDEAKKLQAQMDQMALDLETAREAGRREGLEEAAKKLGVPLFGPVGIAIRALLEPEAEVERLRKES